ncbi:MAG: SIS domain-containing protein [Chloroflexi bacterium]|nr:SIS domain-containing protein [Chloroflexota bacterium]
MTTSVTYHEIISQTNAWQAAVTAVSQQTQALQDLWQSDSFDQVIFTGCGSTYYLSLAAASLLQSLTGHACRAVPGGELVLYPETAFTSNSAGKTVLVALSRSGTTTETVTAVTQFKAAHRGPVVVITNYGHSPLAQLADITITIEEGARRKRGANTLVCLYVCGDNGRCLLSGWGRCGAGCHDRAARHWRSIHPTI